MTLCGQARKQRVCGKAFLFDKRNLAGRQPVQAAHERVQTLFRLFGRPIRLKQRVNKRDHFPLLLAARLFDGQLPQIHQLDLTKHLPGLENQLAIIK